MRYTDSPEEKLRKALKKRALAPRAPGAPPARLPWSLALGSSPAHQWHGCRIAIRLSARVSELQMRRFFSAAVFVCVGARYLLFFLGSDG